MKEKKQTYIVLFKIAFVVLFGFLYCVGGSEAWGGHKQLRRFLAPAILCLAMFGFSRNWRCLVQMPFMFLSLSLGYGADTEWLKILKRGIFGLANGITSSGSLILGRKWLLVALQTTILVISYIVLGVWNPMPDARTEEFLLGMLIALIPMLAV
jgi:cytochrome b subunit of formate dehydrogenase